jgi:hypothetical protein
VTVRNAGTIPATIKTIYISDPSNGNVDTVISFTAISGSNPVGVGQTAVFTCTTIHVTLTSGDPYQIEVMTNTGFSTTGTYYA